jgi:hypothetical protein
MINRRFKKVFLYLFRFVIPITLGISFIVSTGPQVQQYTLSFLNSDVPSIYGSVNDDKLVGFYDLGSWTSMGFHWLYLLISLPIAVAAIKSKKPRAQVWYCTVVCFAVLTAADIIYSLIDSSLTAKSLAQNLASNLVGSGVISIFILAFFSVAEVFYNFSPLSAPLKKTLCSYIVSLFGIFLCCLTYYICDVFYNPLPSKVEIFFSSPAEWAVDRLTPTEATKNPEDKSRKNEKFSVMPNTAVSGLINWTTFSPQTISIFPAPEETKYKIEVALLSGFCTPELIDKLKISKMAHAFTEVKNASFGFDKGMSVFSLLKTSENQVKYSVDFSGKSVLNLSQNVKDKTIQITEFVSSEATLNMVNSSGSQDFLLTVPLAAEVADKFSFKSRVISIAIDNKKIKVQFDPDKRLQNKKDNACKIAIIGSESAITSGLQQKVIDAGLFGSVLVRVSRQEFPNSFGHEIEGIKAKSSGGWIQFTDLDPETLDRYSMGDVAMVQVRGNVSDLIVDNVSIPTKQMTTYTAIGSIRLEYGDQGKIKASGTARGLWRDQSRMNETKWEKLTWEPKLALLSFFAVVFGLFWPLVAKRLSRNRQFTWID